MILDWGAGGWAWSAGSLALPAAFLSICRAASRPLKAGAGRAQIHHSWGANQKKNAGRLWQKEISIQERYIEKECGWFVTVPAGLANAARTRPRPPHRSGCARSCWVFLNRPPPQKKTHIRVPKTTINGNFRAQGEKTRKCLGDYLRPGLHAWHAYTMHTCKHDTPWGGRILPTVHLLIQLKSTNAHGRGEEAEERPQAGEVIL